MLRLARPLLSPCVLPASRALCWVSSSHRGLEALSESKWQNRQKACTRNLPSHRSMLRRHEWLGVGTKGPPCISSARCHFKKSPSLFVAPRSLSCRARSVGGAPSRSASSLQRAHYQSHLNARPPLRCVCRWRYLRVHMSAGVVPYRSGL
jgi:hypothetical protein